MDLLEAFTQDIPWKSLPKTFQEAIYTTANLGLQYLWIDSLCIMQDSILDWSIEAALMVSVYANAVINISADDSRNSNEGLYRDRPVTAVRAFNVRRADDPSDLTWLCFNDISHEMYSCPTSKRAWIVQERFLAGRVVHFARNQVYWECACRKSSESVSDDICASNDTRDVRPLMFKMTSGVTRELLVSGAAQQPVYDLWREYSTNYSNTALTFDSDRVIAISGIARAFGHLMKLPPTDYICGLWKSTIITDLLWEQTRGIAMITHQDSGLPSWSWLSASRGHKYISHEAEIDRFCLEIVARFLRANVSTSGSDPFGTVMGKESLTMRSNLCRAWISYREICSEDSRPQQFIKGIAFGEEPNNIKSAWGDLRLDNYDTGRHMSGDCYKIETYVMLCQVAYLKDGYVEWLEQQRSTAKHTKRQVVPKLIYNAIDATRLTSSSSSSNNTVPLLKSELHCEVPAARYDCLLLQPVQESGLYRRIGLLRLWIKDIHFIGQKSTMQLDVDQQFLLPDVPESGYEEVDDDMLYTFSLV